jgi:hypothetical protein
MIFEITFLNYFLTGKDMDRAHGTADRVHTADPRVHRALLNVVPGFDDLRPKLKITEGVYKI